MCLTHARIFIYICVPLYARQYVAYRKILIRRGKNAFVVFRSRVFFFAHHRRSYLNRIVFAIERSVVSSKKRRRHGTTSRSHAGNRVKYTHTHTCDACYCWRSGYFNATLDDRTNSVETKTPCITNGGVTSRAFFFHFVYGRRDILGRRFIRHTVFQSIPFRSDVFTFAAAETIYLYLFRSSVRVHRALAFIETNSAERLPVANMVAVRDSAMSLLVCVTFVYTSTGRQTTISPPVRPLKGV